MKMRLLAATLLVSVTAHAQYHQSYIATTKTLDLVDGALACPDYDTAKYMYGRINEARHFRKSLPPEQVRQAELAGTAPTEPVPSQYRCVLVPAGTIVHVESDYGIPAITGQVHGAQFSGVTLPYMLIRTP